MVLKYGVLHCFLVIRQRQQQFLQPKNHVQTVTQCGASWTGASPLCQMIPVILSFDHLWFRL
jgi:hypothetical protein